MAIPPPPANPADLKASAVPPPPADPSELKDAVADSPYKSDGGPFEVVSHTSTLPGVSPVTPTTSSPGFDAFSQGLLTNQAPRGAIGNIGRTLPAAIGGALAGPAGAAGLEAVRQAIAQTNAVTHDQPTSTPGQVVYDVAKAGALQKAAQLATPYISKALVGGTVTPNAPTGVADFLVGHGGEGTFTPGPQLGGLLGAPGNLARRAVNYGAKNMGGVPEQSVQLANQAPEKIRPFLGAGPDVADNLAASARDAITRQISTGEAQYPKLIEAARTNPQYAGRAYNLQGALGDKVLEIGDQFGLIKPGPGSSALPGANQYWKFAGQVDELQNASLDQVYQFQKQLNNLKSQYAGKPLGSAFGKLSDAVRGFLGNEIPEIGQANASWAAAKDLEDLTGGIVNKNDLVKWVTGVYNNPRSTLEKQALENAAKSVPGLSDIVDQMRFYKAAQDFTPLVRDLPQTGMGASIAQGFIWDPIKNGAVAGVAAGKMGGPTAGTIAGVGVGTATAARNLATSPRLYLEAMQAGQAASNFTAPAVQATFRGASTALPYSAPLTAQALGYMSPGSIAAFYNSPGAQR